MENIKYVGEVIAKKREEKGLSQRQLAKLANVNSSELSKIEAGIRKDPSPKILRKISNYIDITYNDLMYMIGLGNKVSKLNPFILNYYTNLKGEDIDNEWLIAKSNINKDKNLINTFQNKIDNEDLSEEDKEHLLETINDLTYQIETNEEIVKLLDGAKYKEGVKNAKDKGIL